MWVYWLLALSQALYWKEIKSWPATELAPSCRNIVWLNGVQNMSVQLAVAIFPFLRFQMHMWNLIVASFCHPLCLENHLSVLFQHPSRDQGRTWILQGGLLWRVSTLPQEQGLHIQRSRVWEVVWLQCSHVHSVSQCQGMRGLHAFHRGRGLGFNVHFMHKSLPGSMGWGLFPVPKYKS